MTSLVIHDLTKPTITLTLDYPFEARLPVIALRFPYNPDLSHALKTFLRELRTSHTNKWGYKHKKQIGGWLPSEKFWFFEADEYEPLLAEFLKNCGARVVWGDPPAGCPTSLLEVCGLSEARS